MHCCTTTVNASVAFTLVQHFAIDSGKGRECCDTHAVNKFALFLLLISLVNETRRQKAEIMQSSLIVGLTNHLKLPTLPKVYYACTILCATTAPSRRVNVHVWSRVKLGCCLLKGPFDVSTNTVSTDKIFKSCFNFCFKSIS